MALDVVVYRSGRWWSEPWEQAFIKGLAVHGIKAESRPVHAPRVSDLAVMWSHRNTAIHKMQRQAGKDYLVMERGYLGDRYKWTSLGFNGLNGRAEFVDSDDTDRFDRFFRHRLLDWHDGDYVLVCGQVLGDASLNGTNINHWAMHQCERLQATGMRVRYRNHPQARPIRPRGVEISDEYLPNDLQRADLVVTYNSNAGVDAVMAGCKTIAMDQGSMAWAVTSHDIGEPRYTGDRYAWAARLAWKQWQEYEIADGSAWAHLRGRYD